MGNYLLLIFSLPCLVFDRGRVDQAANRSMATAGTRRHAMSLSHILGYMLRVDGGRMRRVSSGMGFVPNAHDKDEEAEVLGMIGMEGGTMGGRLGGRRTIAEGAMARTNLRTTMRTTSMRMTTITTSGGAVDRPRGTGRRRR
jgi:hypothetical protein